ncbi:hypothetical protein KY320_00135 [Candidatus Woesearchaeota archaeon]|nr:hypothetical protein [Candidatus Woesearchaeota archaeon]
MVNFVNYLGEVLDNCSQYIDCYISEDWLQVNGILTRAGARFKSYPIWEDENSMFNGSSRQLVWPETYTLGRQDMVLECADATVQDKEFVYSKFGFFAESKIRFHGVGQTNLEDICSVEQALLAEQLDFCFVDDEQTLAYTRALKE